MDSKVFNAKSSFGCRNRLNFRLFRYTLWFVYIIVARKVPGMCCKNRKLLSDNHPNVGVYR